MAKIGRDRRRVARRKSDRGRWAARFADEPRKVGVIS